ncbi:hypothetical protein FRC11_009467, partial [Ceratobasidium sp. 423]
MNDSDDGVEQWARESTDFFEIRNYDEPDAPQRIQVLKCWISAYSPTRSGINPFDSQQAKP